ncbi:hypothetical protein PARPLA_02700 [Rhodobacteraceae bacterium THAF1]|uniref:rod shape-determining protein MreD n=1 Tax=Palleronia sp. THAF1 TaxID=2587842 RepID=UPI000F3DEE49|nr:rod shape-determining protein MreD [Palleronia sp. THAF1]QFU08692.1 hypothetical protein FIU81_08400 [Palleronia sp. THAF1]VDC28439.1 hypothetical protein PARPLA_02700 [Rhodobacteraceae bacterium THAF1]
MVDPVTLRRASYRMLLLAIAAVFLFVRILPFHDSGGRLPAPDLLTVLAFAWVLRRPEYVPTWLIACIALMADILFMRPLGLWALITVMGVEFLRNRSELTDQQPFPVEWMLVGGTLTAMYVAQALVMGVFVIPQPAFGATLLELLATVAVYPLVVVVTVFLFGVRVPSPTERDAEARS